jgi:hypothetical protein
MIASASVQDLSRQKFYSRDFSNQDLRRANMRNSLFLSCNFDGADLTEVDATGSEFTASTFRKTNMYRANFKDAKLGATVFEPSDCFGITLTLQCRTFDGMKISPLWFYMWLMFATMMKVGPLQNSSGSPMDDLITSIGAERYVKLNQLLKRREI